DILIPNENARNRALTGDVVAVALDAADGWDLRRSLGGGGGGYASGGRAQGGSRRGSVSSYGSETDAEDAAAAAEAAVKARQALVAERAAKAHPIPSVEKMYVGEVGSDPASGATTSPAAGAGAAAAASSGAGDSAEEGGLEHRLWRPRVDVRIKHVPASDEAGGGGSAAKDPSDAAAVAEEAASLAFPVTIQGWNMPTVTEAFRAAIVRASWATQSGTRQPTARVVSILKRQHSLTFVGTLQPMHDGDVSVPASDRFIRLVPLNNADPWIYIDTGDESIPKGFLDDTREFKRSLFAAVVDDADWDERSRFPRGKLKASLGESGTIVTDLQAILQKHEIDSSAFSEAVVEELRPLTEEKARSGKGGWRVPEEERARRRDLTSECIFTIDPTTAKDLDDALHIKPLGDGRFEVGVHIADVSHFVTPGSAVDEEARRRCTSTYLVTRVIPMLPPILCEELCSLNPNVDRLAFSCIWVMNDKGEMEPDEPWYGRTIIRCCAKLDYPTAQHMIEGTIPVADTPGADAMREDVPAELWEVARRPTADCAFHCDDVIERVRMLQTVAAGRRKARFASGALRLNRAKLAFRLDSDGNPTGFAQYPIKDSNRLVEEYMLMANYLVAEKMIRCAKEAVDNLHAAGLDFFEWEPDSAASLQRSLSLTNAVSPSLMESVVDICTQPNMPAQYFLCPDQPSTEWAHYALAIPYYTHFTSPIRRYADVMVHRVLQATIEGPDAVARLIASGSAAGGMPPAPAAAAGSRAAPAGDSAALGRALVSQQCDTCNERKMAAKRAQEDFDKVYLCVFLRNAAAPFDTWATVEELGGNFCKVVVDGLGLTFQCYYDRNGANGDMDGESTVILTPAEPPSTETAKAAVARLTTAERRWAGQPARAIPFKVTADVTRLAKNRSVHVEPPPEDSSGSGDSAIAAAIAAAKGEGASDADPLIDGDATSAKIEAAATPYPTQLTLSLLSRVRVRLIVRDDKIPS
ncbi:DIS3L2, partial [Symbiodinium sp. KB8]